MLAQQEDDAAKALTPDVLSPKGDHMPQACSDPTAGQTLGMFTPEQHQILPADDIHAAAGSGLQSTLPSGNVRSTAQGIEDFQSLGEPTSGFAEPPVSPTEGASLQMHSSSGDQVAPLVPPEITSAGPHQSCPQAEPLDPFASSLSVPELMLQPSISVPEESNKAASSSSPTSAGARISTGDLAQITASAADRLLSGMKADTGSSAAPPHSLQSPAAQDPSRSAECSSITSDLQRRQASLQSQPSDGLDALSADDDDFAEDLQFADANAAPASRNALELASSLSSPNATHSNSVALEQPAVAISPSYNPASMVDPSPLTADSPQAATAVQPQPEPAPLPDSAIIQSSQLTPAPASSLNAHAAPVNADISGQSKTGIEAEVPEHEQNSSGRLESEAEPGASKAPEDSVVLKPHESAMAQAEAAERRLLTGKIFGHTCSNHHRRASLSTLRGAQNGVCQPSSCTLKHRLPRV